MQRPERNSRGSISEFGPAFFVLLFFMFFPVLNLLWMAIAYVVIALAANHYASAAAVETSYDRALASMYASAAQFNGSGWTVFGGLLPSAGYGGAGADLYLKATSVSSHNVESFGPNVSAPPPIDTSTKVWEYEAKVSYEAHPLVNLSSIPFIGQTPGIGTACLFQYSAHKLAEHPSGIAVEAEANNFARQPNGTIVPALPPGTGGGGVLPTDTSWFNPDIYQQIQSTGQTVIREEVLIVPGTATDWVSTGIDIQPGQNVWIDLRADGMWTVGADIHPMTTADGYGIGQQGVGVLNGPWALGNGMLIGRVGNNDPFEIGRYQLNMVPQGTGPLTLIMNDFAQDGTPWQADNAGQQSVRIIVTR